MPRLILLIILIASSAFAADPICQFAVDRECVPQTAQCHRDVKKSAESQKIKDIENQACDSKGYACWERMRKSIAACAQLKMTLDSNLKDQRNPPTR